MAVAFAACRKGTEEVSTTAPEESTAAVAVTSEVAATTEAAATTQTTTKSNDTTTKKATTKSQTTKAEEAIPISVNEALDKLDEFYGSAYNVNATVREGDIQYFRVTDIKENLYARVEVNLKTSDAKETIEHSGEVNEFNLSV